MTAACGVGPNMFLAKVALDLFAKRDPAGVAELDEGRFRREVWFHRPITDIWGVGPGTARRLASRGVYDLAGVCAMRPWELRGLFGRDAEWLLDHAWGQEPCTVAQCHAHVPAGRSISRGQTLMRDYSFAEARTVLREEAFGLALELFERGLACSSVSLYVGYSGRLAGGAGGSRSLGRATRSGREAEAALLALFDGRVDRGAAVRQVRACLGGVVPGEMEGRTLFDDEGALARERALAGAASAVRRRFGPNALLTGASLRPEGTARERNLQVGGHRA